MRIYFDTSALVPLYVPEALSPRAEERLVSAKEIFVSWLTEVEIGSALTLKTRTRQLPKGDARRVLEAFRSRLRSRAYEVLPVSREVFALAADFIGRFETSLRALDSLHLACCQPLDLTLLTADGDLARGARHFGVRCEHLAAE